MSDPLISVIIPTYNRADLIEQSIVSINQQTFRNFEIIVVDDGSSDNGEEVVARLGVPHLTFIKHQQNRGANAARNTGIQAARGKYIAFQDSDDTWSPNKLEKQYSALEKYGTEICFCAFNRTNGSTTIRIPKPGYHIRPGAQNLHSALLRGSFISCQTLLVKRELLVSVGLFDDTIPRLQDWELCLRLSQYYSFLYLDEALVKVEIRDDSISRQSNNYAAAATAILDKHKDSFAHDPVAISMLCINVASDAFKNRQYGTCLDFLQKALFQRDMSFFRALSVLYRRR